ncbi:MAG: serine--tRNA ligase [Ignavibacteriaceae bacterium]|nr:serine--tRNA ligase [Ignavibacteriaceae bacterium]
MLDIKYIRENPGKVKKAIANKNENDCVDELLRLDEQRRMIITTVEEFKAERNRVSAKIPQMKKAGEDTSEVLTKMKMVSDKITEMDSKLRDMDAKLNNLLMFIPNLPHESVPVGKNESDNKIIREWLPGEFSFETDKKFLDHIELGKKLNILDFERGAKISGSGFPVYIGKGATLERALLNFMLDFHLQNHKYTEVLPPFLVNKASMEGTGQLPKMEDDMYSIDKDGLYPIPTSEVPITNLHRDEILTDAELPKSYVGYSACFRREAGSYGKEAKGFLRVHQFNKVEMVKIVKPESSYDELEKIVSDAEDILQALKIPYRINLLCTGDLSFSSAKCYDIETWSPAENKWLEASSCSNFEDFQARRAKIRFKRDGEKKPEFVHTLNGSGLATSRLMVSLLENYQLEDGTIEVPEVLKKYTGFELIN